MITAGSITLRRWRDDDLDALAALNADPRVAAWLGGAIDREASARSLRWFEESFDRGDPSLWCVVNTEDGEFLGCVGLALLGDDLPLAGRFELVWRLRPEHWGRGVATAAASAALDHSHDAIDRRELVAFTSASNLASRRVMERLGMTWRSAEDFDHPRLTATDPLRPHVVYRFVDPA